MVMEMAKRIRQIAFYGKGGIGKSTIASNIAAAYAEQGMNVMMVGCDPKADCTRNLRGEEEIPTVLDVLREKGVMKLGLTELVEGKKIEIDEIVKEGYKGVLCVEAGGPEPAIGCAGRGVIVAVELLKKLGVYEAFDLDVVIYDVLGDIVCGGFGIPLRRGLADEVYIITSADYLAIYAANNICKGIARHASRGGSPLGGIIYNVRGLLDEKDIVEEFAERVGTQVIGHIPYAHEIAEAEIEGKTVIEYAPDSEISEIFRNLASKIYENNVQVAPNPLTNDEMMRIGQEIRRRIKEKYRKGGASM